MLLWLAPSHEAIGQTSRFPAESVHYDVSVGATGTTQVRLTARLSAPVRFADFTFLAHTCSPVLGIEVRRGGRPTAIAIDSNPPWVSVHDTTTVPGDESGERYDVTWTVHAAGSSPAIPLLLPAAALDAVGARRPVVAIDVQLPVGEQQARVTSPRMTQTADTRWTARLAAAPSLVRLARIQGAPPCDGESTLLRGDSGRFRIIFGALLVTMILWIPLYFAWALRQGDAA